MSMRRIVLAVVASLLLLVPLGGATPAAAKKAPSANKQVTRGFSLLIRDTRKTPEERAQQAQPGGAVADRQEGPQAGAQAAVCVDQDAAAGSTAS